MIFHLSVSIRMRAFLWRSFENIYDCVIQIFETKLSRNWISQGSNIPLQCLWCTCTRRNFFLNDTECSSSTSWTLQLYFLTSFGKRRDRLIVPRWKKAEAEKVTLKKSSHKSPTNPPTQFTLPTTTNKFSPFTLRMLRLVFFPIWLHENGDDAIKAPQLPLILFKYIRAPSEQLIAAEIVQLKAFRWWFSEAPWKVREKFSI